MNVPRDVSPDVAPKQRTIQKSGACKEVDQTRFQHGLKHAPPPSPTVVVPAPAVFHSAVSRLRPPTPTPTPTQLTIPRISATIQVFSEKTSDHFQSLLQSMPRVHEIAISEEDTDKTPQFILASGKRIGQVLENAEVHPVLQEAAVNFFVACAEDHEIFKSVRAHCLAAAIYSSVTWKKFVAFSELQVDQDVKSLAAGFPL
jgi:hypothetical protein